MSDDALRQFELARKEQLDRNEARRMRTLVNQARGDTRGAGLRWPFELTQNAHDAGARDASDGVNIWLTFDGQTVVYEHDGKPFTMQELAALLSGGSSKEFESTETTGRFGSGFLVTHVLSLQIRFQGLLSTDHGCEEVLIQLDRAGDENAIFRNTETCYQAIAEAPSVAALEDHRTAKFEYQTDNVEAAQAGLAEFLAMLPYLYGTCQHLGAVRVVDAAGKHVCFEPQPDLERHFKQVRIREREVRILSNSEEPRVLRAIRVRRQPHSLSGLLTVIEQESDGWRVCVPTSECARLFCRFPVRASDFVPISVVIDGHFDLRQERDRVRMKDSDKDQISEALGLLPSLVELAIEEDWRDGHKLARVGCLKEPSARDWMSRLGAGGRRSSAA